MKDKKNINLSKGNVDPTIHNEELKQNTDENSTQDNLKKNQIDSEEDKLLNQVQEERKNEEKGAEEKNEMEKLQNDIAQLQEEINQWKDKFLRKMAEFDNYKKRIEQDQIQLVKYANEKLIKDLLDVVDDFERTLIFSKEELKNNSIHQGVEMIYNKLMKILSDYGLKKIEALNQPFDFNYHEALLQVPKDGVEPMTVVEEVQKGYMLNDKVIRHTKVIVSSEIIIESTPSNNQNDNSEVK